MYKTVSAVLTSAAKIAANAAEAINMGIIFFIAVGNAKSLLLKSGKHANAAMPIKTGIAAKINCTSPFNDVPILIARTSRAAKIFPISPGEIKNDGTIYGKADGGNRSVPLGYLRVKLSR